MSRRTRSRPSRELALRTGLRERQALPNHLDERRNLHPQQLVVLGGCDTVVGPTGGVDRGAPAFRKVGEAPRARRPLRNDRAAGGKCEEDAAAVSDRVRCLVRVGDVALEDVPLEMLDLTRKRPP